MDNNTGWSNTPADTIQFICDGERISTCEVPLCARESVARQIDTGIPDTQWYTSAGVAVAISVALAWAVTSWLAEKDTMMR